MLPVPRSIRFYPGLSEVIAHLTFYYEKVSSSLIYTTIIHIEGFAKQVTEAPYSKRAMYSEQCRIVHSFMERKRKSRLLRYVRSAIGASAYSVKSTAFNEANFGTVLRFSSFWTNICYGDSQNSCNGYSGSCLVFCMLPFWVFSTNLFFVTAWTSHVLGGKRQACP